MVGGEFLFNGMMTIINIVSEISLLEAWSSGPFTKPARSQFDCWAVVG